MAFERNCLFSLSGYEYYGKGRPSRGVGVGIFAKTTFHIEERMGLSLLNENIESYCIKVAHSHGKKNLMIAAIYTPPSQSCINFITDLNNILEKVGRENTTYKRHVSLKL